MIDRSETSNSALPPVLAYRPPLEDRAPSLPEAQACLFFGLFFLVPFITAILSVVFARAALQVQITTVQRIQILTGLVFAAVNFIIWGCMLINMI